MREALDASRMVAEGWTVARIRTAVDRTFGNDRRR
jgi:hypothetical protein